MQAPVALMMNQQQEHSKTRPEPGDRALPLCYGDLILLSAQFDEGVVGYLCEEGCVMKGLDIEMDVSSRELVFEVCTAADDRALLEYTAYVRKHGFSSSDSRLRHLAQQKEMEEQGNESQAKHMAGRSVTYGDRIQLKQPKSQGFLGIDIGQAPREEPTAKRIVLHASRGRPVAFRIMPRFKYLVEGHTVCHQDRISLVSTEFPGEYVHAHMGFETRSIGVVHEVHLSTNSSTAWVVENFFTYGQQSRDKVKAGDVVRLYHPYHGAYIGVNPGYATVLLEPDCGALSSTMWVIQDENPLSGGLVRVKNSYSFMHLVTRKQLVVSQREKLQPALKIQEPASGGGTAAEEDKDEGLFAAVEVSSIKGHEALITLEPLEGDRQDLHLVWGGRVRLVHTQSLHYLHCMTPFQLQDPVRRLPAAQTQQLARRRGLLQPAHPAHPSTTAQGSVPMPDRVVVASPALFREDSFDLVKVPEEQVRAVDTLTASLPRLEDYLVCLQEVLEERVETEDGTDDGRARDVGGGREGVVFPEDRILDVIEKLTELQSFVYSSGSEHAVEMGGGDEGGVVGDTLEGGLLQPLDFCQNFMRDLGLAELLMAILEYSCRIFYIQVEEEMRKQEAKREELRRAGVEGSNGGAAAASTAGSGGGSGGGRAGSWDADGGEAMPSQRSVHSAVSMVDDEEEQEGEFLNMVKEVLARAQNRTGRLVCQLCYAVLYHMVHKHTANANYLAQYMTQIQDQLVLELGAEKLLLAMLADNETLLLAMASDATKEKHVTFHVRALTDRGKNAMHLRFLSSLAAVGDRGISRHQDLVLPQLLSNERRILLDCFLDARNEVSLRDWYADLSGFPAGNQTLGTICTTAQRPGARGEMFKRMLDYFVESLLLLATLCKPDTGGRREFVVLKVRALLPLRTCIQCLQNDGLPEHLRRNMCEYVRVVHVQDDAFNRVTRLAGVAIWNDLAAAEQLPVAARSGSAGVERGEDAQADEDERLGYMQDLKNIIRDYLSQNTCQYCPGKTRYSNPLKLSMIRLCHELVLYGHYMEADLHAVVKEACAILDFSSMRFIDQTTGLSSLAGVGAKASTKAGGAVGRAAVGAGFGEEEEAQTEGILTEHTVSIALQHLRPLCTDIAPIELARFCGAFRCRVYESGASIVSAGDTAADLFVIQSGAAFMLQVTDGVEAVVDTVGPGEVFGGDTLTRDKKTWPWRVRCSQPVTALHLRARDLYVLQDEMARKGRMKMTDGLAVLLETKREACALINDIFDLRLAVRTGKMLHEYRFDLNISNRVYERHMLTAALGDSPTGNVMQRFPPRQDPDQMEVALDFYDSDDWAVLGPYSDSLAPFQSLAGGKVRIDRGVVVLAIAQYVVSSIISIILALRIKNHLESAAGGSGTPRLEEEATAPTSATVGVHPGPTGSMWMLVLNLVATGGWMLAQVSVCWAALSHARTGQKLGTFVQYLAYPLGAKLAFLYQMAYLLFWLVNTGAGVVLALICLAQGRPGAEQAVVTQAVWLVSGAAVGAFVAVAFASLYVHLDRPALFLQEDIEEDEEEQMQVSAPRREFLKILEYLDLNDNGALSLMLADLIITPYQPLVVDAFNLLVRVHESHQELHAQLANILILTDDDATEGARKLNRDADTLTRELLQVTNSMQGYVVERSSEQVRLNAKRAQAKQQGQILRRKQARQTDAQRALEQEREDMLQSLRLERERSDRRDSDRYSRDMKRVEPLMQKLLRLLADDERKDPARDQVHRKLMQRKSMHGIILRLLGSLPADFTETIGPLCYRALSLLCDAAPAIQRELARHVDVFIAHFDSIPHDVATLLTAVYMDNVDLCYKVPESIIDRVVALMQHDLAAPYLILATTWITPNGQVVRRNQNLITKHLDAKNVRLLLRKTYAPPQAVGALSRGEQPASMANASDAGPKDNGPIANGTASAAQAAGGAGKGSVVRRAPKPDASHLASIQLLTACMADLNHDNKKRCRGGNPRLTLKLAELQADLYDRSVPVSIKIALVAFLRQAYIQVDMPNMALLLLPQLSQIFDDVARFVDMLATDAAGSKVRRMSKLERVLLTDSFMAAAKDMFSALPASDLRNKESARVRVAGRLLEVLVDLLTSSRQDLEGDEELRVLEVIMLLARSVNVSFERYKHLVGGDNKLRQVLGDSALTPKEDDVEDAEAMALGDANCQRKLLLEKTQAHKDEQHGQERLSVPDAVHVFADEFRDVMAGPGSPINEFQLLCNTFRQPKAQAPASRAPVGDGGAGDKGGAGADDEAVLVSDQHMESLVDLITQARSLTPEMLATGLGILHSLVKDIDFPTTEEQETKDGRDWLRHGVPRMVIHLMTAPSSTDAIVLECLRIGIVLLERGQKPAQQAFYLLLTQAEGKSDLLQTLRDRLVRGERGLKIFHDTFMRLSTELRSQCVAQNKSLTIAGVAQLTRADRLVQSFLGSYPEEVLRFLQLLCEGHNRQMQEYMRHQGKTSIDMVTCAADFLGACSRHMHPASIGFATQCVDSLIEFVQNPCYGNQRALVDTQLPHVLNQFLQLSADLPIEFADVDLFETAISDLQTKSVTLLLSLLERVDDLFIPSRILKALEIDKLLHSINALRHKYLGLHEGEEPADADDAGTMVADERISNNKDFRVACSLFMLVKMLQYFDDNKVSGLASKCRKQYIHDIERLEANCGFIEISRAARLERIFFQIPAVCRYLSKTSKTAILRELDADNHQDKMLQFVETAQLRYDEMCHLQELHKSAMYRAFLVVSPHLDVVFFLNAALINTIALLAYHYSDDKYATLEHPTNIVVDQPWDDIILALAICQLVLALSRVIGYYVELGILRVKRIFTQDDEYYKVATELYGGPRYYYLFTRILLSDGYFLLLCFFAGSTLVALGLRGVTRLSMFLIMTHLFDMFNLSPSLANVTVAVSSRAGTLVQTAILAFVMMYIYSAWGFVLFAEYFSFEAAEVEGGDEKDYNVNAARCDTIWKVFFLFCRSVAVGWLLSVLVMCVIDLTWLCCLRSSLS